MMDDMSKAPEDKMAILVAALEEIVAAHLGDCPASMDEADFARAHNHRVRRIARDALIKAGVIS